MVNSLDVTVIGGGPAGIAAALALRAHGFSVMVADGAGPCIDKACGEGLMPDSVAALAKLGVDVSSAAFGRFAGIRFIGKSAAVEARFPKGEGIGVRRPALHALMVRAAMDTGVKFRWGAPVSGLAECQSRWIVGADGGFSAVRRWSGLNAGMQSRERFGFRKHFRISPWSEFVEVYWGDGCQIYVTPVGSQEVGVAAISRDRRLRVDEAVARFPSLAARLKGSSSCTVERGAVSASRRLRRVTQGSLALIGDASGSVDAVTGEGLSLAFHQAPALAAALAAGDLRRYEKAHARIRRTPAMMAGALLLLDGWTGLRNRVLPAMAARPLVFEQMLAGHVSGVGPLALAGNLAALGWAMLV